MSELSFYLILIIAAMIQVGVLTLIVLSLYRVFISKHITRKQATSVFIALTILDGSIGVATYSQNDTPTPTWWLILYCLTVVSIGFLVTYYTRSRIAK